jgi:SAM-dependent methyltransferase
VNDLKFLDAVTPDALRERVREIAATRPEILSALDLVGSNGLAEWIHTFGPTYDELKHLLPAVPPLHLRSITGPPEVPEFLRRGAEDVSYMFDLHDAQVPTRSDKLRVLDFGCGCGRLSRFLSMADWIEAFACDANPDHVDWCSTNLPAVDTRLNRFRPPLPFDAGSIDFVYALSVFTHLPQDAAADWFRELSRVIAAQGLLIITTHGYPALATIKWSTIHQEMFGLTHLDAARLIQRLQREAYIFLHYQADVVKLANVGSSYGNTFMDVSLVHPIWDEEFDLVQHVAGGLERDWQDAVVLKKK